MNYRLVVIGTAVPKGSKRAFVLPGTKRAVMVEANKNTKPWMEAIQDAAMRARGHDGTNIQGPVALHVEFYLPRPKSAPKRITRPAKKPDADKLARAVGDALTGILWRDDAQVVWMTIAKEFAGGPRDPVAHGVPRAEIRVAELEE